MMILVIGGSGSGKSSFAEQRLDALKDVQLKYYLATMMVFDEDGRKKVKRHKEQRQGKGFLTLEQPEDIEKAAENMQEGERAVLLECMSNLVANEMFSDTDRQFASKPQIGFENRRESEISGAPPRRDIVAQKIVEGIKDLQSKVKHLIIVTNNVFEDGIRYEDSTMEYMETLSSVNRILSDMADEVAEVIAGIPVVMKKERGGL